MRKLKRRTNKHSSDHVDAEGSWAISYGDMITLLLSFFVLYFTVDHDKVKANQMQQAMILKMEDVGIASEKQGFIHRVTLGDEPGEGIDPRILLKVGAVVKQYGEQLVVEFKDVSFFNLSEVDVNKTGVEVLNSFAKMYTPFAGRYDLKIGAYTDSRKVRDGLRFKDNLELSALRSVAAMRVLQKAGLPLRSMKLAGFGEFIGGEPSDPTVRGPATSAFPTKDPMAFDRKVVLVIEPKSVRGGE